MILWEKTGIFHGYVSFSEGILQLLGEIDYGISASHILASLTHSLPIWMELISPYLT